MLNRKERMESPEIVSPEKCIGCGTSLEDIAKEYNGFLVLPCFTADQGGLKMVYGVMFHCCPKCGSVMINQNAHENTKKFNQMKIDQVIKPKSSLILPGNVNH
jgi:hypothetical protein